jgi:hypothetical protein
MSRSKLLSNKLPLHRRKKEVLVLIIIGSIIFSAIFFYSYIFNSQVNLLKFPRINITCEDNNLNTDDYINCTFELECNDDSERILPLKSRIRIRGSGSKGGVNRWPKKGYRLELSQQKSLLGMRKDDDWILFALYTDYPRTRIKLSMDIWRTLEPTNPTAILPKSKYVTLYLNSEFQGLYLIAEKNDRKLFGLDDAQNNINSSLIIQARKYSYFTEYDTSQWEQDWPNEDEDIYIKDEIMADLIEFINNSDDDDFFDPKSGVYTIFDKQNLIDFYVYNYFILHEDFWSTNFFIVRNTYPSKFFLIPWDFDHALGQYMDKTYYYYMNPESVIRKYNELYNRLLDNEEFRKECKNRWFELREELWTDESILDMLQDNYEEIIDILELDTNIWNPFVIKESWENNVDESVSELFHWIPNRIEFCDSYFAQF